MNTWTLGELKKAIADCPELSDETPIYMEIITHNGDETSTEHAVGVMESFGTTGSIIIMTANHETLDKEDEENLL